MSEHSSVEAERWGDDPRLVSVLGGQGAEQFRALFDAFPEAVGILWALRDEDGSIADFAFGYGNPTMLRRSGLPASTRDRFTLLEALPQMRDSRAFDAYVQVCETGTSWVKEIVYDTPFGDGYMLGTFIHRAARLGDGLIVFLHDITEQRRMETELRGYADVVAHDLSEPLAGIAMLVGFLERNPEQPPDPEILRQLRLGTQRARQLIDGVLLYARSGELQIDGVALRELVAEVTDDLRPRLEEARATVRIGELPEVVGDRGQLRRVLQNLVQNAVKFRRDEPLSLEISAADEDHEWVVSVSDNGVGVDPERSRRIFEMFSRAGGDEEGVGIGLAVCRRIVETHGGQIWVEPADGGGSVFRFTLPKAPAAQPMGTS